MNEFFGWLRKKIFGDTSAEVVPKPMTASTPIRDEASDAKKKCTPAAKLAPKPKAAKKTASAKPRTSALSNDVKSAQPAGSTTRGPHFFQIGLDFGTAYTKCIVRDVVKDHATVFVPPKVRDSTLPFLMPSQLSREGFTVDRINPKVGHYGDGTISLLKMALSSAASGRTNDPATLSVRAALTAWDVSDGETAQWIEGLTALFLGATLRDVRAHILRRFDDWGKNPNDYIAVNLAIPVAELAAEPIRAAFARVLNAAWLNCEAAVLPIDVRDWMRVVGPTLRTVPAGEAESPCFVYPEVSANVQGFVRSRSSTPGMYLFCDTGAGTVDQSIFIFSRSDEERLIYLGAQVLPLGSALLEHRAAAANGNTATAANIELLRKEKETGRRHPLLDRVRATVAQELSKNTLRLLATVKVKKLDLGGQLNETELIFGGGGHVENPYEIGVRDSFSAAIFREGLTPRSVGIPVPRDLELPKGVLAQNGLRRLSVAYGLSFPKFEIAPFKLPDAVKPAQRVRRRREIVEAPTMDDC